MASPSIPVTRRGAGASAAQTQTQASCPLHPGATLRRFRADGPDGRGVYLFCLANGEGLHLVSDQAVSSERFPRRAADDAPQEPRSVVPDGERFGLTDAELEVLRLAARGCTTLE